MKVFGIGWILQVVSKKFQIILKIKSIRTDGKINTLAKETWAFGLLPLDELDGLDFDIQA